MILLADENMDASVVARLRENGHLVLSVAEMEPGISDTLVLALANEKEALLVTEDKDFGELVYRQKLIHHGVILLRLAGVPAAAKGEMVCRMLDEHGQEMLGAFAVLSPGVLRIRLLGNPGDS